MSVGHVDDMVSCLLLLCRFFRTEAPDEKSVCGKEKFYASKSESSLFPYDEVEFAKSLRKFRFRIHRFGKSILNPKRMVPMVFIG